MKKLFSKKVFKTICLLLVGIIFFIKADAQTFCPAGATWYYNGNGLMFSGYHKLTYTNDSVVGGINCQKITDYLQGWDGFNPTVSGIIDSFYTYSSSGVTFIFNDRYGANQFDTLFNLNANIGDKWRMPLADTACNFTNVTVLDTGSRIINSLNLKWVFVNFKPSNGSSFITDTIIERIGFIKTFFYFPMVCQYIDERMFDGLRCYSDNTFGSYSIGISSSCDYYYTSINEANNNKRKILLYPNPSNGKMNLEYNFNKNEKGDFIITDIVGRVVRKYGLNWNEQKLDLDETNLPNSVYLYQFLINEKIVTADKFVIVK